MHTFYESFECCYRYIFNLYALCHSQICTEKTLQQLSVDAYANDIPIYLSYNNRYIIEVECVDLRHL